MASKTKRAKQRRLWSEKDVRELRQHSRAKTPVAKIATLTRRTLGALRQRQVPNSVCPLVISGREGALRRGRSAHRDFEVQNCPDEHS